MSDASGMNIPSMLGGASAFRSRSKEMMDRSREIMVQTVSSANGMIFMQKASKESAATISSSASKESGLSSSASSSSAASSSTCVDRAERKTRISPMKKHLEKSLKNLPGARPSDAKKNSLGRRPSIEEPMEKASFEKMTHRMVKYKATGEGPGALERPGMQHTPLESSPPGGMLNPSPSGVSNTSNISLGQNSLGQSLLGGINNMNGWMGSYSGCNNASLIYNNYNRCLDISAPPMSSPPRTTTSNVPSSTEKSRSHVPPVPSAGKRKIMNTAPVALENSYSSEGPKCSPVRQPQTSLMRPVAIQVSPVDPHPGTQYNDPQNPQYNAALDANSFVAPAYRISPVEQQSSLFTPDTMHPKPLVTPLQKWTSLSNMKLTPIDANQSSWTNQSKATPLSTTLTPLGQPFGQHTASWVSPVLQRTNGQGVQKPIFPLGHRASSSREQPAQQGLGFNNTTQQVSNGTQIRQNMMQQTFPGVARQPSAFNPALHPPNYFIAAVRQESSNIRRTPTDEETDQIMRESRSMNEDEGEHLTGQESTVGQIGTQPPYQQAVIESLSQVPPHNGSQQSHCGSQQPIFANTMPNMNMGLPNIVGMDFTYQMDGPVLAAPVTENPYLKDFNVQVDGAGVDFENAIDESMLTNVAEKMKQADLKTEDEVLAEIIALQAEIEEQKYSITLLRDMRAEADADTKNAVEATKREQKKMTDALRLARRKAEKKSQQRGPMLSDTLGQNLAGANSSLGAGRLMAVLEEEEEADENQDSPAPVKELFRAVDTGTPPDNHDQVTPPDNRIVTPLNTGLLTPPDEALVTPSLLNELAGTNDQPYSPLRRDE